MNRSLLTRFQIFERCVINAEAAQRRSERSRQRRGRLAAPAGACPSPPHAAGRAGSSVRAGHNRGALGSDTSGGAGPGRSRGHRAPCAPRPRPRGRRLCPPAPPALTGGRCGGRGGRPARPHMTAAAMDGEPPAGTAGTGTAAGTGGCGWRGRRSVQPRPPCAARPRRERPGLRAGVGAALPAKTCGEAPLPFLSSPPGQRDPAGPGPPGACPRPGRRGAVRGSLPVPG